ncbi:MAG: ABC transporter substrate-binding protein [Clostridiales bacterium]|nr:ABC transporter substrate-binding protein [Clostridiales bacterium]
MATPFVEQMACDAANADGGIYIEEYDTKIPIEIIVVDTESDPAKAGEIAEQLATKDQVNMFLARHTPNTTIPVALTGEKHGIPTVSNGCPTDPLMGAGPFEWVFHGFWDTGEAMDTFVNMWKELGYGEGTKIGLLLPNDADAIAWKESITARCEAEGFIAVDPGTYEMGNQDWTNIINTFKSENVQILCGNDVAPNFSSFLTQAVQQNLQYDLATMGRAFLFPSDANALPLEAAEYLTNETWWAPSLPYVSSLDGMTARELADKWMEHSGDDWYATLGDKYSGMEIIIDALTRAASLDPEKIRQALIDTDLQTIAAHIKYDPVTHTCVTPIAGGQWRLTEDGERVEVHIVYTGTFPAGVQPDMAIAKP